MAATVMQSNVVLSGLVDEQMMMMKSVRCVRCSFVGLWDTVEKHVHERHTDMSTLRGNEYRIGGAQQLDMSGILFTTQRQLYSCFVQELTSAGRSVYVYKDPTTPSITGQQEPRAILRHTSELQCANNRSYQLEWNKWFTIPMKDLDRFADSRNYEICLLVE